VFGLPPLFIGVRGSHRGKLVGDVEDVDVSVSRASKERVAISRPSERNNPWLSTLDSLSRDDFLDDLFVLEIPDFDGILSSCAEPVVLWGESQGLDGRTSSERVQVFGFIKIPEHGCSVLSSTGAERSIRGDGDSVDDTFMTLEGSFQLEVSQVPDLDFSVPTTRNQQGVLGRGGESDTRDPVLVLLLGEGEFAFTQGVPELDRLVSTARCDLPVVSGEGNGVDVRGVSNESLHRFASCHFPQTEGLIPRC